MLMDGSIQDGSAQNTILAVGLPGAVGVAPFIARLFAVFWQTPIIVRARERIEAGM
jgi:hypothetical protein